MALPGDFRRFKRVATGKTLVMGRRTFESIGHPLAGRRNIVVTSQPIGTSQACEFATSVDEALEESPARRTSTSGSSEGAASYAEAMQHVDLIDVTGVPDRVRAADAVRAPRIDSTWEGNTASCSTRTSRR